MQNLELKKMELKSQRDKTVIKALNLHVTDPNSILTTAYSPPIYLPGEFPEHRAGNSKSEATPNVA